MRRRHIPPAPHTVSKVTPSNRMELPASIHFHDPRSAERSLGRIRAGLPSEAYEAACHFLADSPDPDLAVVLVDRLLETAPAELARRFATHPSLIRYAILIFGHSAWLGETLIQNRDILERFEPRTGLERSFSREDFKDEFARWPTRATTKDQALTLAQFRKREYVRILLRDLLGIAKLAETTEEISALADCVLQSALLTCSGELRHKIGVPQGVDSEGRARDCRFAIVSLGKLGGNELNYSSDVDLLFLYDSGAGPSEAATFNREYFVRLAQQVTALLSRRTREGQVFRIDLRLRPQGHEGEPAVPLRRAIQYYSEIAQDWELQAMIKARHSAGDADLTREFTRAIAPYVYRPNVNFAAVKTALQTRERIDRRGRKPAASLQGDRAINVKLDRGGIRDIEFLVQCLQRVYGGEEGWLRSRGTLFALQKLHDKEHISGKDFHNLTKAYEFLRHLEHQLQLRHGRQNHQLPASDRELAVLAQCMNRGDARPYSTEEFVLQVQGRMSAVAEIYRRIVYQEQSQQFVDAEGNLRLQLQVPQSAENSYSQIMQRLALDAPQLLGTITRSELSQHARRNIDRFLSSASTSSERYGAVLRSQESVQRALRIFECSEYLTDVLVRYPRDVAWLQDVEAQPEEQSADLFPVNKHQNAGIPDPVLAYLAQSSVEREQALGLFRQEFRQTLFRVNARDLYRPQCVYEMLAENSRAADKALEYALAITDAPSGFAVMALGRLGSREFDLLSDADVLFVAEESTGSEANRRAAERVMEILTAYTRDGTLFPVDTRLRPLGREGELVTTPGRLANYFTRDARAWEALTYLRLRYVAGDHAIAQRATEAVRQGIGDTAKRSQFEAELADMRRRLEESDSHPNFKTGAGGAYDIDYLTGRFQARHGLWSNDDLSERVRLVAASGLIAEEDASELARNAEFLRGLEHYIRVVTGRAGKWLPVQEHAAECVAKLMSRLPQYRLAGSLAETATEVVRRTREIYIKYPF